MSTPLCSPPTPTYLPPLDLRTYYTVTLHQTSFNRDVDEFDKQPPTVHYFASLPAANQELLALLKTHVGKDEYEEMGGEASLKTDAEGMMSWPHPNDPELGIRRFEEHLGDYGYVVGSAGTSARLIYVVIGLILVVLRSRKRR